MTTLQPGVISDESVRRVTASAAPGVGGMQDFDPVVSDQAKSAPQHLQVLDRVGPV